MAAPVLDQVCADVDLQGRMGAGVLQKACSSIPSRDQARALALEDILNAFADRVPPITSADFDAMTPTAQRKRLRGPVAARACELICDWAFTDGDDMWGDRAKKFREEWQSMVAGNVTDEAGGGGGTTEPVVRSPMRSIEVWRR